MENDRLHNQADLSPEGNLESRILVLENDETVGLALEKAIPGEVYIVRSAPTAETALIVLDEFHPDLIILDRDFANVNIVDFCMKLREKEDIPILMISKLNHVSDRISGLDSGADDYLGIPYDEGELQAQIRALLRRTQKVSQNVLIFADLALNISTRQVQRSGQLISLTAKEFDLLKLFMQNPRRVMTREVIFDRVWGYDFGGVSNVLDVYIRYLRQKLEREGSRTRLIQTTRGIGYVLREE
jgi:two-component system, OmpR family, response regulator MprA